MEQLLISGAVQGPDGHQGVLAVALIMDLASGDIVHRCEYSPPPELVSEGQKIQFTGSCFRDGSYFVCSHNEILVFDEWPPRTPSRRITIPGFNDLHHVFPWKDGLAVSNTGLETVDHISTEGELIERWDLLREETDCRVLDESKDIRLIPDTKPHLRHGNHIFAHDGQLWSSQLRTSDAVCVSDLSRRMEMSVGMPHDGTLMNGSIVFTTTNGFLVFFDASDISKRTTYELTPMVEGANQLGWCRGVCPHPTLEDHYYVMFSALRRSKWKEFGYWVKHGHNMPKSHVGLFDLKNKRRVSEHIVGEGVGYQLFQVDVLPDELRI